jgi:hypothetical protein
MAKKKKNKKEKKIDLSTEQKKKLKAQVQKEYKTAKDWIMPFYQKSYKNLKLYLNEKRDDDKVGDPILYTVMNTIHASMYSDIPAVKFRGRTIEDIDTEFGLNLLVDYDYDDMEKDQLDMDWLWDACFFGYGIVEMTYFDRARKIPSPRLVDPFCFLYAPDTGGELDSAAYCGEELQLTRREMKDAGVYIFEEDDVVEGSSFNDLPEMASKARTESQGKADQSVGSDTDESTDNSKVHLVEWRTWFEGKRVLVALANDLDKIVRYKELDFQNTWGYVEKKISRTAHQFKGASIPDMVGDKQRMRSEIINLAATMVKGQQYPHYIYNNNLIRNRADLRFGFNKFTGVPGNPRDVVVPMNQYTPNMAFTNYILQYLDAAAQRATASAEMQQGVLAGQERTLGELNLVAQKADTRYALMMKTLMMGEKRFWQQWYAMYKKHFKDGLDEKVLRLTGDLDQQFYTLTRTEIISDSDVDPDVEVVSTVIEEAKTQKELGKYVQLMNAVATSPDVDRRTLVRQFAQVAGISDSEIDAIFPPTVDELTAEMQNVVFGEIASGKKLPPPEVLTSDNHMVHMRIHRKADPTPARNVHMRAHLKAMVELKKNPDLDPRAMAEAGGEGGLQPGEEGGLNSVGFQPKRAAEKATGPVSPAQEAKLNNEQAYGYNAGA